MENKTSTRSPTDFLSTVLGQTVKVRLNSGIDYKGNIYTHLLLRKTHPFFFL